MADELDMDGTPEHLSSHCLPLDAPKKAPFARQSPWKKLVQFVARWPPPNKPGALYDALTDIDDAIGRLFAPGAIGRAGRHAIHRKYPLRMRATGQPVVASNRCNVALTVAGTTSMGIGSHSALLSASPI